MVYAGEFSSSRDACSVSIRRMLQILNNFMCYVSARHEGLLVCCALQTVTVLLLLRPIILWMRHQWVVIGLKYCFQLCVFIPVGASLRSASSIRAAQLDEQALFFHKLAAYPGKPSILSVIRPQGTGDMSEY